jgi:hypothetical protein
MPIVSGKAVGSQNVAKAGVNLEQKDASLVVGGTFTSAQLVTSGMPKLTWVVTSTQAHSVEVQPQIALRRTGVGVDTYEFIDALPVQLCAAGTPVAVELNMPCQAMRLTVVNPGAAPGAATAITVVLGASG